MSKNFPKTEVLISSDCPITVTLTPRPGFTALFQLNHAEGQYDAAWLDSLIDILKSAKDAAEAFDYSHPRLAKKSAPKEK